MRRIFFISAIFFCQLSYCQIYFYENFEHGINPAAWSQEYITGTVNWFSRNGGGSLTPQINGSGNPPYAFEGDSNAFFTYASYNNEATKLITPPINLEFAIKPQLRFMHAQEVRFSFNQHKNDVLKIYCKSQTHPGWLQIAEFPDSTLWHWEHEMINLPDTILSDNYFIAFEAITKNGWGVCLDSIRVVETGYKNRKIDTIEYYQPSTTYIPTATINNPVLMIKMKVSGNIQQVILNQLQFTAVNSSNSDIMPSGVRLYVTTSPHFSVKNPLDVPKSIISNTITFTGLNYSLPTGYCYFWLTYDIQAAAIQGNTVDAAVPVNGIQTSTGNFPSSITNPAGSRILYETIFSDDFESDKGWTLVGEFERDKPRGLGGTEKFNPDPSEPVSDSMILGTDITGILPSAGDYENNIANRAYQAISPLVNCFYYKDVRLRFQRWLNIEISDSASIDISADNGVTWRKVWSNPGTITEEEWKDIVLNLSKYADRRKEIMLRFTLGPTNTSWKFSGWNIDDLFFTGDFVEADVGVTRIVSPVSGIHHTANTPVSVYIKNFGPVVSPAFVPVMMMITDDSGSVIINDTLTQSINPGDSVLFVFTPTLDLTRSTIYYNAFAATQLTNDEYSRNDTMKMNLFVLPVFDLPYSQNFSATRTFWLVDGTGETQSANSSWQLGVPNKVIIKPLSPGNKSWVTKVSGAYNDNDDSYLMSPYFNFNGIEKPYFECKMWYSTQDTTDGAALEYTIDTGRTWHLVDHHTYPWPWNWYPGITVTMLGSEGWNGNSSQWITVRQVLPDIIRNKTVCFRMRFASDSINTGSDGIAFDEVVVSDAPADIGVYSIDAPVSSCELSKAEDIVVTIRNYGIRNLKTGEKIIVAVKLDQLPPVIDTVILNAPVMPGSSFSHTFSRKFDFYLTGNHSVVAYTMQPDDKNIYDVVPYNNDTAKVIVEVRKPYVELGNDIYSVRPDTVVLNAYFQPGNSYLWQDGSTGQTFDVKGPGVYHVSVTNAFCTARDTVTIIKLIADLTLAQLLQPVSSCDTLNNALVKVVVKNNGTDTFTTKHFIVIGYILNSDAAIQQTLTLTGNFYPGQTMQFTYAMPVTLNSFKTANSLKCFIRYNYDSITLNDTLRSTIYIWGKPDFDLTPDDTTLYATKYLLNARKGNTKLVSYLWNNGSADSLLMVYYPGGYYQVTVTDIYGCRNTDVTHIALQIMDLSMAAILQPSNSCGPLLNGNVLVNIINTGTDVLPVATVIDVGYQVSGFPAVAEPLILSNNLNAGDSIKLYFANPVTASATGSYSINAYLHIDGDSIPANDTIQKVFSVFNKPAVWLGKDTVLVNQSYFTLDAGPSFVSYLWQDMSTTRQYVVNGSNNTQSKFYIVRGTDANNCTVADTIMVDLRFKDIGMKSVSWPDTLCYVKDKLRVTIANKGTQVLTSQQIHLTYSMNSSVVRDTVALSKNMYPNDSASFTFDKVNKISAEGNYSFKAFAEMSEDIVKSNDTLKKTILIKGAPEVLGYSDTIRTVFPYNIILSGSTYVNYLWHNGSTLHYFIINSPRWVAVTITLTNGCLTSDSLYIGTGIAEVAGSPVRMSVYPNPVSGILNIAILFNGYEEFFIELSDASGRILEQKIYSGTGVINKQMDLNAIMPGVYYLSVTNRNGQRRTTVINKQ